MGLPSTASLTSVSLRLPESLRPCESQRFLVAVGGPSVLMLMRSAAAPAIMRLVSLCALWRVLTKAARRKVDLQTAATN